jgi:hypothetical protein
MYKGVGRPYAVFGQCHSKYRAPNMIHQLHSLMPSTPERNCFHHTARTGVLTLLLLGLMASAAAPVAAQDGSGSSATNPICQDSSNTLSDMIEGFVQITTGFGLMGLLVVWQADSLMEMVTLSREQKAKIKQHKRGAMRSAAVLVVLGPLFTVAGPTMGLPIAQCVDLIPF